MARAAAAGIAVAVLALSGCSGDGGQDQALPSTTSSPEVNAGTEPPEEPVDPFCAPADALGEGLGDLAPTDGDPDQIREQFTLAREAVAEAEAEAPEEIRPDVAVLADGYEDFFEALEAADFDITQLSLSALTALDTPEMQAASERIDAYRVEACGEAG